MAVYKVEICGVNTSKLPLLTSEEKEDLFKRILDGDQEAREQYIKGNLRLVLSVIQRSPAVRRTLTTFFKLAASVLLKPLIISILPKTSSFPPTPFP